MAIRVKPAPDHLKKINQKTLDEILRNHKLHVKTKGRRGELAVFHDIDFSGCTFRNAWLQDIDFRGNWLQDCDFNFARVDGCNFKDCWVEGSTSHNVDFTHANIDGTLWAEECKPLKVDV